VLKPATAVMVRQPGSGTVEVFLHFISPRMGTLWRRGNRKLQ